MNMQLFGVMATVEQVSLQNQTVKVAFDKETEEAKIHDPFFGQKVLRDQQLEQQINKRYYSD